MVYIYRTPIDEHRRHNQSGGVSPSGRSSSARLSPPQSATQSPKVEYPSSVSFSCVICIEDFDEHERPPMVLPCGHTYVCLPCTKQLTKCMECRQSLFLDPPETGAPREVLPQHPSPNRPLTLQQMRNMRRTATTNASSSMNPKAQLLQNNSTPQKKTRISLPIPKNVVLLALMEAKQKEQHQPSQESPKQSTISPQQKFVTPPHRRSPALEDSFALLEEKKDDDRLIEPTSARERRLQRHRRKMSSTKGSPIMVSSGMIRSDRSEPGIEVAQDFRSVAGDHDDLMSMDDRTVDYFEGEHRRTCMDALLARRYRHSPSTSSDQRSQQNHKQHRRSKSYGHSITKDYHNSPLLPSDDAGDDSFTMARAKQGGYRLQMNNVQLHPI